VREYWIVDWRQRQVEVYRRRNTQLEFEATLADGDTITTPLLPGFALPVSKLWEPDFRPDAG
jgi:Uma2 family endonuclease